MALGIASIPQEVAGEMSAMSAALSPPAVGLYTAVVAGVLISAFGGSRVQIGGPTAAFIPIVFGIASAHGFAGLVTATLMAGVMVMLMGVFRLGALIKFIPYPVTTGFTAGIAVTIVVSQLKDLFGLEVLGAEGGPASLPAHFVPKLQALAASASTASVGATVVGLGSLGLLIALRRLAPRVPGAIVAVVLASAAVALLDLPVETIGSRFGGIPSGLPRPRLPSLDPALVRELMAPAATIAVLCAIESLLSAVVADGMTGSRHRSDQELIGQGLANVGSALFMGLPATGAIARTVANIKSGGRTPVAGIVHALVLLAFMLLLSPLARLIPLATLSAVLLVVAWNISEIGHFRSLLRAPRSDVAVLLSTFALTVLTDLTLAVGFGMVLASVLFIRRMVEVSGIGPMTLDAGEEVDGVAPEAALDASLVPPGVEVYEIQGPFFFGVADRLKDTLAQLRPPPRVFVLRMRHVPAIDATGMHALEEFIDKCRRRRTTVLLSGVRAPVRRTLSKAGLLERLGPEHVVGEIEAALAAAGRIVAGEAGGAASGGGGEWRESPSGDSQPAGREEPARGGR